MPGLFILGLVLIPIGHLIERWRKPEKKVEEETLQAAFVNAMKSPIVRRRVIFVAFATLINVIIVAAAVGLADVYKRNVFPDMNVTWDTYPTHLGHQGEDSDKRGCFRCHDDQHKTADGKLLSQDCDTCHNLLEMEASPDSLSEPLKALRSVAH